MLMSELVLYTESSLVSTVGLFCVLLVGLFAIRCSNRLLTATCKRPWLFRTDLLPLCAPVAVGYMLYVT
jgi:hypothetical protein